jgi:RimJ/RimL family protein N-acetyltransferase
LLERTHCATVDLMSERTITAHDGEVFAVHALTAADTPGVVAAFEGLSPRSSRLRFFSSNVQRLGRGLFEDLATPHDDHVVLVALDGPGSVVAEARATLDPAAPGAAEIAITVVDRFQARGLGGALLRLLASDLRTAGIQRMRGNTMVDNHAARRLLSRGGALLWVDEPGILGFEIPLRRDAVPSEESLYRALQAAS